MVYIHLQSRGLVVWGLVEGFVQLLFGVGVRRFRPKFISGMACWEQVLSNVVWRSYGHLFKPASLARPYASDIYFI